jgi:hypothetical protein
MHDALARALAAGATVVTPNRRLARHLIDEYDRDQRAAGKAAWPSARALPWPAWLAELEGEAMAAGASPPLAADFRPGLGGAVAPRRRGGRESRRSTRARSPSRRSSLGPRARVWRRRGLLARVARR